MVTNRSFVDKWIPSLMLVVLTVWGLFPVVWMFLSSLKPPENLLTSPVIWVPRVLTLQHYATVLQSPRFIKYFFNSFTVASSTLVIALVLSVPAAYAFARFRFPLSRGAFLSVLMSQLLPQAVVLWPVFVLLQHLRLLNKLSGLTLSYLMLVIPFSIYTLRGYMAHLPREIEEAALIDGCSPITSFWRIVVPMSTPGIAATGIYIFISSWNEYMFALVYTNSTAQRTLMVGIHEFMGEYFTDWGAVMAASSLVAAPALILFVVFRRFFIEGIAQGGVKG